MVKEGAGKKVSQLGHKLKIPEEMVPSVLVNHRLSRPTFVAQNGDLVFLEMVIGGG